MCLQNARLLVAGYDLPMVDSVILTVPVGSAVAFEQIVGRAARGPAVGGTARATIFDPGQPLGCSWSTSIL